MSYGVGHTQEESIADLLLMLAQEYAWLLENKDKLSPVFAKEFEKITRFFGGRDPMPEAKCGVLLVTEWCPSRHRKHCYGDHKPVRVSEN